MKTKFILPIIILLFSNAANSGSQINSTTATSSTDNVGGGYAVLDSLTTGENNSAGGYMSLTSTTEGSNNTAGGYKSLYSNTTGNYNTALGNNSLYSMTTGSSNIALGANAMEWNTTGSRNVAIGDDTLLGSTGETTSSDNTAVGSRAMYDNTTGVYNTALGTSSLQSITTGANNTSLGYQSGYSNVTGSGNIFIGYQAGYNETGSNKLYIDNSNTSSPLIYGDFDTNTLTINGSLNIQDPTADEHAASRRYVDRLASIAAVLDTRMPAPGKNNRVTLNAAGIHNQSAIGLSIVGLFEDDIDRTWDYSLGVAASNDETMTKAGLGFSW